LIPIGIVAAKIGIGDAGEVAALAGALLNIVAALRAREVGITCHQ
jgi:hypothetical protein